VIEGDASSLQEIRDWRPDFDEVEWFETLEEAVEHGRSAEGMYREINEPIALFKGEERVTFFFRTQVPSGEDALGVSKGWIKQRDDKVYYIDLVINGLWWINLKGSVERHRLDEVGEVRFYFNQFNAHQLSAVDDDKTFIWGLSQTPRIHTLQVEGQSPDNIIPVELDGETAYFWYFEDFQTDRSLVFQEMRRQVDGDMIVTMDD